MPVGAAGRTDATTMHTGHTRRMRVLLAALLAAALLPACSALGGSPRTPAFYAELAAVVAPEPAEAPSRLGSPGHRTLIRWWYDPDPLRWRWEVETRGTVIDDGAVVTVVNGEDFWEHDQRSNSVRRGILRVVPQEEMLLPTHNAGLGPVRARTVDSLVAERRESGDYSGVALAGEATLLGRSTRVVELVSPAYGVVRVFVDPERMFIMRRAYEADAGGEPVGSEVTALEYDTEHDPRRFSVLPPADAREVAAADGGSCAGSGRPVGAGSFPPQPGFLHPAYAPGGYRSLAAGAEAGAGGGCAPVAVWALLEGPGGARLVLRQRLRPGGLPRSVGSWHPVDAGLDDAHGDARDGVRRLVWRDGDVVALLEAEALPLAELIRIAESARPAPGAPR